MTTTTAIDLTELVFSGGLPGFPGPRRFGLCKWGETEGPYSVLVDLEDPDVRFLVVPPDLFFPDYAPEIDDSTAEALELASGGSLVLLIVSLGGRPEEATANLLGPIVINTTTGQGAQAVLGDRALGTRVPLLAA